MYTTNLILGGLIGVIGLFISILEFSKKKYTIEFLVGATMFGIGVAVVIATLMK